MTLTSSMIWDIWNIYILSCFTILEKFGLSTNSDYTYLSLNTHITGVIQLKLNCAYFPNNVDENICSTTVYNNGKFEKKQSIHHW